LSSVTLEVIFIFIFEAELSMSPGKVSSENGQWLARRDEYGQEHPEWEEVGAQTSRVQTR
jgi:hypothetical protein